jgi:hypothetical protein
MTVKLHYSKGEKSHYLKQNKVNSSPYDLPTKKNAWIIENGEKLNLLVVSHYCMVLQTDELVWVTHINYPTHSINNQ